MALTCPRCGTEVPSEALYCPYCSLPKPKSAPAAAVDAVSEETKRAAQPNPSASPKSISKDRKSSRPAKASQAETARRLRLPVVSIAVLVALLSVGVYIFVVPLVYSGQAEPKVVLSALNNLRRMPSSEAGLTIDALLARELETSRRVKNLISYQGWTVQPIKGTTTRVLMVYSYQEVGDVNKRAEWIADLTNNTFTAQTDLASSMSAK